MCIYIYTMVVQSTRIACLRGNSILFPSSGGSKHFKNNMIAGKTGVTADRCARAMLVVQLRECYGRLITRGIVTFNFSPRNLTQVTSTMKPGQDSMFGVSSVKRITLREGLY